MFINRFLCEAGLYMFSTYYSSVNSSFKFILDILDGMSDWVRVIDRNCNVIFINRSMEEALKVEDLSDKKCYEIIGCNAPCENCTTRQAIFEGKSIKKEEVFNDRIYSIMSSPIIADDGNIYYVVEVLRDVTKEKELENEIIKQNQKLQHDLEMAKKLQYQLLPNNTKNPYLDFAYAYQPCEDLSGDMVNIFRIDKNYIGVYIADVSGHGVSASMLTIFLISTLNKKTRSPASALHRLFKQFNNGELDKDLYITLFYGIYNTHTQVLTYSNAGHNCIPLIINDNKIQKLYSPGTPISNWVDKPNYFDSTVCLNIGDKLFLYTDGITDQWLEEPNELISDSYIMDILLNKKIDLKTSLDLICKYVHTRLDQIGAQQKDDMTMALIQPIKTN
jgi:sigma-B regulation protein RsbU (phosphoserine phosphatase)